MKALQNDEIIFLTLASENIKLHSKFSKSHEAFDLDVNQQNILEYDRILDDETKTQEVVSISSEAFKINDIELVENNEKKITGIKKSMEFKMITSATKVEINKLQCSASNFIQVLELLQQIMLEPNSNDSL